MLPTDMVLLYGNNREEDIIFRQDLDNMQSVNKNLRIVYTLTSSDIDRKIWKGRTGYIDDTMIKEEMPDYTERIFYICGPPRMVESLINILRNKLSVQQDKIRIENFIGY
jgi:ferredoxin-NADP reductase